MPKMKNQETKNIVVRKLKEEDLEAVSALSLKCFGPENGLKMEHLQSQLELFPEGQICATLDGKVVGAAMSVRVKFEDYGYDHNYYDVSDHGYIRNHNPEGQDLYGIEVAVDADYRGMKIGRHLYEGRRQIVSDLNLDRICIGGRMPNYYKYANELSAAEYAEKVAVGEIFDPVLTFQMNNGFKLDRVIANYLPGDEESLDYGAFMIWDNPNKKLQ